VDFECVEEALEMDFEACTAAMADAQCGTDLGDNAGVEIPDDCLDAL
jgi:hypothetical protein